MSKELSREEMREARLRALEGGGSKAEAKGEACGGGDIDAKRAAKDDGGSGSGAPHMDTTKAVGAAKVDDNAAAYAAAKHEQEQPSPPPPQQSLLGEAASLNEADLERIRRLLWDAHSPNDDRRRWHQQGFNFAKDPAFGLEQGHGGPCGVLAAVQAEMLRCLLFGASADGDADAMDAMVDDDNTGADAKAGGGDDDDDDEARAIAMSLMNEGDEGAAVAATAEAKDGGAAVASSSSSSSSSSSRRALPQPTVAEMQMTLAEALLTILARVRLTDEEAMDSSTSSAASSSSTSSTSSTSPPAGSRTIVIVTCRQSPCCVESIGGGGGGGALPDHGPNTEASDFAAVRFDEDQFDEARAYFTSMLPQFQSLSGVVLFMMSVLLTRGEARIRDDMDDSTATLVGQFGHCNQELLNLLLSGAATSNVFDGTVPMGDTGLTLRGIPRRSAVGYLTHLEALRYCQVGSFYKTPSEPVWVVGSTSHFTVLFSLDRRPITESRSALLFAAASRAFKQQDTEESGYIPKDKLGDVLKALAPPSETKDGPSSAASSSEYFLPANIAHDAAAVSALTANLEMAGNGIVLWTDFWRTVSRLMSGASLEAVLAGDTAPNSGAGGGSGSSGAGAAAGAAGGNGLEVLAEVSSNTGGGAISEEEQINRAIAESMGKPWPESSSSSSSSSSAAAAAAAGGGSAMVHPEPLTGVAGGGGSEDDDLARAIAASMSDAKPQEEPVLPQDWECPVCTYHNDASRTTCEMCQAAKPDSSASSSSSQSAAAALTESSSSSSSSLSSSSSSSASSGARLHRADSIAAADDDENRIELFHYNGLTRSSNNGNGNTSGAGSGSGRAARLVRFSVVKRSDEELVGAAVSLNTSGGLGGALMGSDHAVEDVLRTRWQGARIDWEGQTPPSID